MRRGIWAPWMRPGSSEILASLGRLFGPDAAAPDELVIQDWSAEKWTRVLRRPLPHGRLDQLRKRVSRTVRSIHWAGTERQAYGTATWKGRSLG